MTLLLAALALWPQDDLDARLDELAGSIEAGPLAELLKTEHGRLAIQERIDSLAAARTARLDRDPQSPYEDWFFSKDERGAFRLRPERRTDWEALKAEVARAPARMAPFLRRCDAFAARIQGEGEMEKRARAAWSSPEFRTAFFNLRPDALEEPDTPALLKEVLPHAEELQGRLQEMAPLTGSYFKQAAAVRDDTLRGRLVSELGVVVVLGRVLRQAYEGSEKVLGGVSVADDGRQTVSFNVPLAELGPLLKEVDVLQANPLLAAQPPALRALLAEKALGLREARKDVADAVFAEVVEDAFEAAGEGLKVKKGRFVDGDMNESPDAYEAEQRSLIDVFRGARTALDQLVELCADPAEAAPFADLAGGFIVVEHQARVVEELRESLRAKAFDLFRDLYLEKKGGRWAARPERAAKIDEIVKRAAEIKAENP
jgi:hypothetical protein